MPDAPEGAVKAGKPVTLLTQEIRFAATLTGGVSLAVWMGGIARELDILVHASDDRIAQRQPAPDPVQNAYRKLLDLLDVTVCVDVLAGTSAGGINAALLGLVTAQRKDLSTLRDIWLKAGSLSTLLRDPNQSAPPSLLQGDGQLLSQLSAGIRGILGHSTSAEHPRPTDVFITTTLLSPELSRFTDDYGTSIDDADHHGLFHFRTRDLNHKDVVTALSLAARSSASFPGAFEPAFLPCGEKDTDSIHPDMSPYSTMTAPHWAADGGLLINRPIAPLLDTIFERAADREVRRALLYIVPTSGPAPKVAPDELDKPLGLAGSLLKDLAATQDQSIAADLKAIREHNDRVDSRLDTRLQLAALGARLKPAGLTDASTWSAYRARQGESLAEPITAEIIRRLRAEPGLRPEWSAEDARGNDLHTTLLAEAIAVITKDWPAAGADPAAPSEAAERASRVGRPAFNAGKAVVLDLLRAGFALASGEKDTKDLAAAVSDVHADQGDNDPPDLMALVWGTLKDPAQPTLEAATATIARNLTGAGDENLRQTLETSWTKLTRAVLGVAPTLCTLAAATKLAPDAPDGSWAKVRSDARHQIAIYLDYLGLDQKGALADEKSASERLLDRLLDLIVAERALSPAGHRVDQRVELIQISSDTRNELTGGARQSAETKLTGLQLHHFGAFYKASWRANDWMWGRLDGAGWLTHILLDPRRILAVTESSEPAQSTQPPMANRAEAFLASLENAFGPLGGDGALSGTRDELLDDLAFLNDARNVIPGSLPRLSLAVASAIQLGIAKEELRSVQAQIQNGEDPVSANERRWLADYAATSGEDAHIPALLAHCPIPDETLTEERDRATPLFLRTATRSAAVATSALTAFQKPPASLAPVFTIARTITRTAWVATDRTHGNRRLSLLAGVLLMVLGIAALVSHSLLLGIPGLAALGAGMLVVAIATWRSVPRVVGAVLALGLVVLAAAPWLPWLDDHLRSWLQRTAIPFLFRDKWAWPIVFLLLLLPAVTSIIRVAIHRKPSKAPRTVASGAPGTP
jgi:patatin-related protein